MLEGLFGQTPLPSRALIKASYVASGTSDIRTPSGGRARFGGYRTTPRATLNVCIKTHFLTMIRDSKKANIEEMS